MNIFSILLVAVGLLVLCGSLIPLTKTSHYETGQRLGWRFVYALNWAFILGYLYFLAYLWGGSANLIDLVLAIILFGGGVFVYLVSQMSVASLECIQKSASAYEKQSLHDVLTGLPNRKQLFYVLAGTLAARGRDDDVFSVMVMDLNGFKEINDTLGHHAGDKALQMVAPRLQQQLRSSDTLCRMGGDEFAVVLPKTSSDQALLVAQKMLKAFEPSFKIEEKELVMGISIGIACCPEHSADVDALIQFADIAMYQAKRNKTGVEIYIEANDSHSIQKLSAPHRLQKMIANEELELRYQPISDHGEISGMEVSVFWPKIDGERMTSGHCMSLVEYMGLGEKVNHFILQKALAQYSQWQVKYEFKLHLSLMVESALSQGFHHFLEQELKLYAIKPSKVTLEMPEPALRKNRTAIGDSLKNLDALGLSLSIKNFGGHGAALVLIRDNPFKELKLDALFSKDLDTDVSNQAIIQAAQAFCSRLGIFMVVEGGDSEGVVATLKGMGIHRYQGQAFCPALKIDEVKLFLEGLS
ncbi:MAG: diguanylate cyclase [Bermanella sp.]